VLDSVSITVNCLVSHIHSEVCRLDYRLAGHHIVRLVMALFSTRSLSLFLCDEYKLQVFEYHALENVYF
jgi:hypothetical protein